MKNAPEIKDIQAEPKFDLKTHHRDAKGRLTKVNPYRLHVIRGTKYFERPVGSGNLFYENNEEAGVMEYELLPSGAVKKTLKLEAPHKAWTPPLPADEKVLRENEEIKRKNEELQRELDAIRGERAIKPASGEAQSQKEIKEAPKQEKAEAPLASKDAKDAKGSVTAEGKAPVTNYGDML